MVSLPGRLLRRRLPAHVVLCLLKISEATRAREFGDGLCIFHTQEPRAPIQTLDEMVVQCLHALGYVDLAAIQPTGDDGYVSGSECLLSHRRSPLSVPFPSPRPRIRGRLRGLLGAQSEREDAPVL